MTTQSQNACLKFFEEPGAGNIVILTNQNESGILETLLSRLQVIRENSFSLHKKNEFYLSMIESHIAKKNDELIIFFFSGKFEK
jgi:DNA polymerase III delta prime subunit